MTREDYTTLIEGIGTGEKTTAAEMRLLLHALKDGIALTNDMKPIKNDEAYIALNFDSSGLGRLEREGWARCNGLNGTWDCRDRALIGHGGTYTTPGFALGSKDAVLIEHEHDTNANINYGSGPHPGIRVQAINSGDGERIVTTKAGVGESGVGKNIPPSIVVVWIQKL